MDTPDNKIEVKFDIVTSINRFLGKVKKEPHDTFNGIKITPIDGSSISHKLEFDLEVKSFSPLYETFAEESMTKKMEALGISPLLLMRDQLFQETPTMSSLMRQWVDLVRQPHVDALKDFAQKQMDIILYTTKGNELKGRCIRRMGSMRQKKHQFVKALEPRIVLKQTFKGCYPTSVGEISDTPDKNGMVTLNVSFATL